MRKIKMVSCLVLLLGALLGLSGCSSKEPDTKELFTNVSKNMQEVKSMNADFLVDIDFKMTMGEDTSMAMKMDMNGAMEMVHNENVELHTKLNMKVSAFGQNQEATAEMYQVVEDGKYVQYKTEDGEGWEKEILVDDMNILSGFVEDKNMFAVFADNPSCLKYIGTTQVNEKDAYEYTLTIDKKLLDSMPKDLKEELYRENEDSEEIFHLLETEDLKIVFSMFIYEDDETLAKISCDLGQTFDQLMKKLIETEMDVSLEGMDISFETFKMEMAMEYNKTEKIVVPQNVQDNAFDYSSWEDSEPFDESLINDIAKNENGERTLQHFLDGGFIIIDEEDPMQILEVDDWHYFTIQRDQLVLFIEVDNEADTPMPANVCQVEEIEDWSSLFH